MHQTKAGRVSVRFNEEIDRHRHSVANRDGAKVVSGFEDIDGRRPFHTRSPTDEPGPQLTKYSPPGRGSIRASGAYQVSADAASVMARQTSSGEAGRVIAVSCCRVGVIFLSPDMRR